MTKIAIYKKNWKAAVVSAKKIAKFMIPIPLFGKFLSKQFIVIVELSNIARCSSKSDNLRNINSIG